MSRALRAQASHVDPTKLTSWAQEHGWTPHPTSQPKTLSAWADPSGEQTLMLPHRSDDQWFAHSAARLVDAVCVGAGISLSDALVQLDLA